MKADPSKPATLRDEILAIVGAAAEPITTTEIYRMCTLAESASVISSACNKMHVERKLTRTTNELGRFVYGLRDGKARAATTSDVADDAAEPTRELPPAVDLPSPAIAIRAEPPAPKATAGRPTGGLKQAVLDALADYAPQTLKALREVPAIKACMTGRSHSLLSVALGELFRTGKVIRSDDRLNARYALPVPGAVVAPAPVPVPVAPPRETRDASGDLGRQILQALQCASRALTVAEISDEIGMPELRGKRRNTRIATQLLNMLGYGHVVREGERMKFRYRLPQTGVNQETVTEPAAPAQAPEPPVEPLTNLEASLPIEPVHPANRPRRYTPSLLGHLQTRAEDHVELVRDAIACRASHDVLDLLTQAGAALQAAERMLVAGGAR